MRRLGAAHFSIKYIDIDCVGDIRWAKETSFCGRISCAGRVCGVKFASYALSLLHFRSITFLATAVRYIIAPSQIPYEECFFSRACRCECWYSHSFRKYGAFTLYVVYIWLFPWGSHKIVLTYVMLGTVLRTKISLSLLVTILSFFVCFGYCFLVYVYGEIFTGSLQGDYRIFVAILNRTLFCL
jgi:hypothetical protein